MLLRVCPVSVPILYILAQSSMSACVCVCLCDTKKTTTKQQFIVLV